MSESVVCRCGCGARFKVPPDKIGRQARCPKCRQPLVLTPAEPRPQSAPVSPSGDRVGADHRLPIRCSCGAKLVVPSALAAHKVKCPRCGTPLSIQTPQLPVGGRSDRAEQGGLDLIQGFSESEPTPANLDLELDLALPAMVKTADADRATQRTGIAPPAPVAAKTSGPMCPSCGRALPIGAVLCVQCGINLKTGRAVLITDDASSDQAYNIAEKTIRWLSFIILFGLYPIASEAFGTRKPWVARGLAIGTIIISLWFCFAVIYNSQPSVSHLNLMLWSGTVTAMQFEEGFDDAFEEEFEEDLAEDNPPTQPNEPVDESTDSESGVFADSQNPGILDADGAVVFEYRPYQLFSHAFLHGGLIHLASNMLFLVVFGFRVNALIGNIPTLIIYPLLILASGIAQLESMAGDSAAPLLGASGAVMGLAGMYFVLCPVHKVHMAIWFRLWVLLAWTRFWMRLFAVRGFWVVLFYIAFDVVYTAMRLEDNVAHWAHLGGFISGMLIALILLCARLVDARGGDLISAILGRHAWAIIGKPTCRRRTLW